MGPLRPRDEMLAQCDFWGLKRQAVQLKAVLVIEAEFGRLN